MTRAKTRNASKKRAPNAHRKPNARRSNPTRRTSGHSTARASNRRRNPRRRRSNPQVIGIVKGSLFAAGGAILTKLIAGFIPIGGGGWMDVAKQLVAAYGAGWIAERFTSPANAQLVSIGGFASAAGSALNLALGQVQGITSGLLPFGGGAPAQLPPAPDAHAGVSDLVQWDGMGDIVAIPDDFAEEYYVEQAV